MARNVNAEGLKIIKQWEGLKLTAYKDGGGVWTIGYGHTSAAGAPIVKQGMKITNEEAERILRNDLDKFEADVVRLVKVPLNDNQFAALVSFHFNTGALGKSTLLKKLNKGDYKSVPSELMKWVNDNGKRVQGLVNRRSAEVGLWAKGSFVSSNTQHATPAKKEVLTKENITWGTTLISALGLSQVSGPVAWALAGVIVIAVGVGVYLFIKSQKEG